MPYITPDSLPEDSVCRPLNIPNSPAWLAIVSGAVNELSNVWNWEQVTGITPQEAADRALALWLEFLESPCAPAEVETPFWDDATDVDDNAPTDSQVWYGEVTSPTAPPAELDFVENAFIWLFTGFLAVSGEIGAAIAFHTIAPRFVLAWKAGDVGEIIRIVIDSADYGTVDTTGHAGEVITKPIQPSGAAPHDILLIKLV